MFTNPYMINTAITIGSTVITSAVPASSLSGLTSVTSTSFTGALTGTASNSSQLNGQSGSYYLLTTNMTEGTKQFYTSARTLATPLAGLSTATNALISSSDTLLAAFGKLQAQISTISSTGSPVSSVNSLTGAIVLTTTNITEGANLYFTNVRGSAITLATALSGLSAGISTAITSSDTVLAAFSKLQAQITTNSTLFNGQSASYYLLTTNMVEGTNQFHTDARVRSTVLTGLSTATGGVIAATDTVLAGLGKLQAQITTNSTLFNGQSASYYLLTTNILEGTNLFYTDVRAKAAALATALTGLATSTNAAITSTDTILSGLGKLQSQITNFSGNASQLNGQAGSYYLLTTNMTEGTNLFYTDVRAKSATLSAILTGFSATNSTISATDTVLTAFGKAQGQINAKLTTPAGTTLQYMRGDSSLATLNTSIVPESGNLYYTDTRVRSVLLVGISTVSGGGLSAADTILGAFGKLEYRTALNDAKITYPGPPAFSAVTSKPTTISGYGITDTVTQVLAGLSASSGGVLASSDTILGAFGKLEYRMAINDAKVSASIPTWSSITGKPTTVSGYGITDILNLGLTGLSTSTSSVISAIDTVLSGLGKLQAQITTISSTGGAVSSVNTLTGAVVLTTTNIAEGTNLYLTNTRVIASVLTGLSTATNSSIVSTDTVLIAAGKLQAQLSSLVTGVSSVNSATGAVTLTTSNISEGSNLYHTSPRTLATTLSGLSTATNAVITSADTLLTSAGKLQAQISGLVTGVSSVNSFSGSVTLTTTNISEGTNQYFTSGRTLGVILSGLSTVTSTAITSADSIIIAAGKLQAQISGIATPTTTTVTEGTNLYFTTTRVLGTSLTGLSTATNATISSSDTLLTAAGKLQAQISGISTGSVSLGTLNYAKTGGTTTLTLQNYLDGDNIIDARTFGAVADDLTRDQTSNFMAAIAALGTKGGIVTFPNGKYAVNLKITANNVELRGGAGGGTRTPGGTGAFSYLCPWDKTKPVVQIGYDTTDTQAAVYHVKVTNVRLYGFVPAANGGGVGWVGFKMASGAQFCTITGLSSSYFTGYAMLIGPEYAENTSGSHYTQPIQYNNFFDIDLASPSSGTYKAVLGMFYVISGGWNTANYFTNLNMDAGTNGKLVINDGCELWVHGGWWQSTTDTIQMRNTVGAWPYIIGNVEIEFGDAASNAYADGSIGIELPPSGSHSSWIGNFLKGNIVLTGGTLARKTNSGFSGYISGTTLTVSTMDFGTIGVGDYLLGIGGNVTSGTTVLSQISGTTGGVGTYTVSASQTVASSGTPSVMSSGTGTTGPVRGSQHNSGFATNGNTHLYGGADCYHFHALDELYFSSNGMDTTRNSVYMLSNSSSYLEITNNISTANSLRINSTGSISQVANGGTVFTTNPVSTGVNYLTMTNSVATSPVILSASGSDTDVSLKLSPKGAGSVNINGGVVWKRNAQSGSYSIIGSDYYVVYTGSGGNTFTLPAASLGAGKAITIKHVGSGTLTVSRAGSDTIDGSATLSMTVNQSYRLISNGNNGWEVN